MQRSPRRLRELGGAFVPFCPSSGGMGVGGDVRSFQALVNPAARDPPLDFFRAGCVFLFLKSGTLRRLKLARATKWTKAMRDAVRKKLYGMWLRGEQAFNMRIKGHASEVATGPASKAKEKIAKTVAMIDALSVKKHYLGTRAIVRRFRMLYRAACPSPASGWSLALSQTEAPIVLDRMLACLVAVARSRIVVLLAHAATKETKAGTSRPGMPFATIRSASCPKRKKMSCASCSRL